MHVRNALTQSAIFVLAQLYFTKVTPKFMYYSKYYSSDGKFESLTSYGVLIVHF